MYRVMIADDEALIREGLHHVIPWEDIGFQVTAEVENAQQVIEVLEKESVDVLLTDIRMPGMDGLGLLEYVKENYPGVHTVIISGYHTFEYAVKALKHSAEDYILKPVKQQDIRECMLRVKAKLDAESLQKVEREDHKKNMREYFLYKLLYNSFVSTEELNEIMARLEIPFTGMQYAVIVIDYKGNEKLLKLITEAASEAMSVRMDRYFVVAVSQMKFDIVVLRIMNIMQRKEYQDCTYTRGSFQTFENLCISYSGAVNKLNENGNEGMQVLQNSYKENQKLKEIIDAIETGAYANAKALIEEKLTHIQNTQVAKRWCVWLMDALEQYFNSCRLIGEYQQALKNFEQERGCGELKELFMVYADKVFMTMQEKNSSSAKQLAGQVREMVLAHYFEKDFSLTLLANMLDVSYGYLSTVVKQVNGKSFTEYLTQVRMQKAAKMLQETNNKIYEIAEKTGYGSARYFTETFKSYYGTSPKEYKNLKAGQKNILL